MASSHHAPQAHHHSQPLPPPSSIHHSQYNHSQSHSSSHARLSQSGYAHDPGSQSGPSGGHSMSGGRQLPPLTQSPSYGPRQDNNGLPPLSPYSQRPYPSSQNSSSYTPQLSRQGSQHQPPPPPPSSRPPPPNAYHPPQAPPPLYSHPSTSSSQGHWDQGPPRLEHNQPPGHHQPPQRRESMDMNGARRKPSMSDVREGVTPPEMPNLVSTAPRESEENGPPASDFVKKLARMLDDQSFAHVVCWGPKGDCFVVKDMTEFTKTILPRMFKHSNFASFVRQLNKYDFHKIKNPDDSYGDQSWTFHHPDFQRSNREALENIKRKVPAQKKGPRPSASGGTGNSGANGTGPAGPPSPADGSGPTPAPLDRSDANGGPGTAAMQAQIDMLLRNQEDMAARVATAERNYQNVLNEMVALQKGMAAQDALMQGLISHFISQESGKPRADGPSKPTAPLMEAGKSNFEGLGHLPRVSSLTNMGYSSSTASIDSTATLVNPTSPPELTPVEKSILARQESAQRLEELRRARETGAGIPMSADPPTAPYITSLNAGAAAAASMAGGDIDPRSGLRVFANGQIMPAHMQPRAVQESMANAGNPAAVAAVAAAVAAEASLAQESSTQPAPTAQWTFTESRMADAEDAQAEAGPSNFAPGPSAGPSVPIDTSILDSPGGSRFRIRSKAFVPGWAVPPRVLLVDDDLVSRKLFSKFLQVSGCTIDVAVDGIGAVNKMNLEKYDLVLMDIVMPKLDGVSATSLIRQFDHMTPIISMTSNSKPNDVVTYYSSGMNDILPKPFTRETLYTMLEKHLNHLKAIQQLSKPSFEDLAGVGPDAGMSITDDQYSTMVANLLGMNGDASAFATLGAGAMMMGDIGLQKRPMDVDADTDRELKRPRFEVVE